MNSTILKYLLTAVFVVITISSRSQSADKAYEYFKVGNYFEAIDLYKSLLKKEPDNPEYNQNMGLSYLRTNIDKKKALDYLLKAAESPKHSKSLALDIAKAHMYHLQFDEAMQVLKKYQADGEVNKKNQDDFNRLMDNCQAAIDLVKYPVNVSFENLGDKVNSIYPDYHPFITKDGKNIFFTSRRKVRPGSKPEFDGYFPSDIYQSTRKNGEWQEAQRLSDRINTIYDEQTVGLTDQGDTLFFYIDHVQEYGDIYISTKKNNQFIDVKKLENIVNTVEIESACSISRDKSSIIFSSNRKGGKGGLDIYMIRKLPTGEWGPPENLGEHINTPFDEDFPTLSADGKTLYFCSEGHPGMGGFDLFFSTWDQQSLTWTKPQNMGYPINTPNDEKNISFTADGKSAVMTALGNDTQGDLDIYEVNYQQEESDNPAIFLLNVALDEDTEYPEIKVRDEYDEPLGTYFPNKITGRYVLALYPGKYFLYVDAPGYKPHNEILIVNSFHTRQDQNVRILKPEK